MKLCSVCGFPKEDSEFNWKNRAKGLRQSACKQCHKIAKDKHYVNNKAVYKKRTKEWKSQRIVEISNFLLDYLLNHPCVKCGQSNVLLLEFDHLDPSVKDFEISTTTNGRKNASLDKVKSEIAKCQVLCVVCHRLKTLLEDHPTTRVKLMVERGLIGPLDI